MADYEHQKRYEEKNGIKVTKLSENALKSIDRYKKQQGLKNRSEAVIYAINQARKVK